MSFLAKLGLAPSEHDKALKGLVERSYQSARVVGRGTIKIDPKEVRNKPSFKVALGQARAVVDGEQA